MRILLATLLLISAACSNPQNAASSLHPLEVRSFSKLHAEGVLSVAFLSGGQAISSGVDDRARIWDTARGVDIRRFAGPRFRFQSIALAPSGCCAFTPAPDGTVRYWTLSTGKDIFIAPSTNAASVALSANGKLAASAGQDPSIHIWSVPDGKEAASFEVNAPVVRVAFSGIDEIRSVLVDGRVCAAHLAPPGPVTCATATSEPVSQAAFSLDARLALIGSSTGTLLSWDADHGAAVRNLNGGSGDVVALAISPTGTEALSGGSDKTVRLWNLDSGARIASTQSSGSYVSCVAFSSNGALALFGSDDGTVALWRLK